MDTITEKKYTTANFEGLFKLENLSDNKTKFLIYGLGESGKAAIKFLASENVEAKNIYILDAPKIFLTRSMANCSTVFSSTAD